MISTKERMQEERRKREERREELQARIYKRRLEFCDIIGKIVPELKKEIKDKNSISMTTEELVKKLG